jgi:hypothetical protein
VLLFRSFSRVLSSAAAQPRVARAARLAFPASAHIKKGPSLCFIPTYMYYRICVHVHEMALPLSHRIIHRDSSLSRTRTRIYITRITSHSRLCNHPPSFRGKPIVRYPPLFFLIAAAALVLISSSSLPPPSPSSVVIYFHSSCRRAEKRAGSSSAAAAAWPLVLLKGFLSFGFGPATSSRLCYCHLN